jgi:hypothetical protein
MSQTQATLVKHVLQDLGALAAGATVDTDDSAVVTERLTQLYADLSSRRIYVVSDANALANDAYPSLLRLAVELCAPAFGRPANKDIVAAAEAVLVGLSRLARASTGLTRRVLEKLQFWGAGSTVDATHISDRVQETLDDLAQRGVIYIADETSVATQEMPHLATILATCFLPPSAANERAVKTAEIALNRISRNGETTAPTQFEYASLFQRARRGSYNGS